MDRARNNYSSTKSRLSRRTDALGDAARRGLQTAGDPVKPVKGWFTVASSPLHGFGVFAKRKYSDMQEIVMGVGRIVSLQNSSPTHSFDMAGAGSTYAGLAFDCSDDATTNTIKNFNSAPSGGGNAQVFWHGAVPVVYAITAIQTGDEILLNYTF